MNHINTEQVKKTFSLLGGETREVRVLNHQPNPRSSYSCTTRGYFDNAESLVESLENLKGSAPGVYITLNPVDPALMARGNNRLVEKSRETTSDPQITSRRWLLIDIDPCRPSGISASEPEKQIAKHLTGEVYAWLRDEIGMDRCITADSGNGYHLIYPVDLPNDNVSSELVKRFLNALADKFDTSEVKVDRGVFNASRIFKLYGTVSAKGDHTEDRPHRVSTIRKIIGDVTKPYTAEDLKKLAGEREKNQPAQSNVVHHGGFSLSGFMQRHGITGRAKEMTDYAEAYIIDCPFDREHGQHGEVHVGQRLDGKFAFSCKHNSCQGKGWKEFREVFDPKSERRGQSALKPDSTSSAGMPARPGNDNTVRQLAPVSNAKPHPESESKDWRQLIMFKDDSDKIIANVNNAQVLLSYHPDLVGVFGYNEFTKNIDILQRPPWETERGVKYPRSLSDVDDTRATAWLERHGCKLAINTVHNAIVSAAHHNPFHPLQEHLQSLKWDGVSRLDTALNRLLGCADTEYSRAVSRRFMIGAVARALNPGCKMDTMLILEGPQGLKKSTAVAELFGEDWFTDELGDLGSKDAGMQVQGVWCVEIAELSTMNRAEANRIKEWITRRVDRFRPAYGRNVVAAPRQCVLVGTVNPEGGYLKDATGGRRFWPIKCTKIDIDAIKADKDQLWAEAVAAYESGERWWFDSDECHIAEREQEERYESDPWSDDVYSYVGGKSTVSVRDVMIQCLDLPAVQQNQTTQNRVAKILVADGWRRVQRRINSKRLWVYVKYD